MAPARPGAVPTPPPLVRRDAAPPPAAPARPAASTATDLSLSDVSMSTSVSEISLSTSLSDMSLSTSVSEMSESVLLALAAGQDTEPPQQERSLLLSADAIKQLQETAALPIPMDDSGLVLSDAAILKLGRAAVGGPASPTAPVGPAVEPLPDPTRAQGLSPSGILRMAAGLRLGEESELTRADAAVTAELSKLTGTGRPNRTGEPTRPAKPAEPARSAKPAEPPRPAARPVRAPAEITNLKTVLLSPVAGPPASGRTGLDGEPAAGKKAGPDELADTAIRPLQGPITVKNAGSLPAGAAPLMRRPTSTGMVIVPAGATLGEDIELGPESEVPSPEPSLSGRKAVVTRKAESTMLLGESSPGAKPNSQAMPTQKGLSSPPGLSASQSMPTQKGLSTPVQPEETAIRQVFQRFGPTDPRDKGRPAAAPELAESASSGGFFSLKLLIGLLAVGAVGAGGWFGTNWYLREQQVRQLATTARTTYDAAFERGRLADFVGAEAQLRILGEAVATDDAARLARALLLTATRFEFGGGPPLQGGSEWEQESLGAVRQIETEPGALAQAALVFSALAQGELPAAEQHLQLLQGANTGEGRYRLPNGMVDYLASQVALLAGREEQALLALQRAVQKQRLGLWQRRLGYLLLRSGRDEEAIVILSGAQKRQEDLVGAQIDLAYARGRTGKPQALTEAKQVLQGFVEPPRSGADPAGRSEHARAALFLADLTLRAEPSARAAARELLTKAQSKAPATDLLFQEELAQARLRIGDGEAAAAILREVVTRLPQRRAARILLAQALVAAKQGGDALTALTPLIEPKDKGDKSPLDAEAQLLRAQALFISHDTLAAQQVTRQVMAATSATSPQHIGAQLLTGELFLKLGEPVSARRSVEPLMRLVDKAKPGEGQPEGEAKPAADRVSADQRLHIQLLWARTLLAMRPPQQTEARALLETVVVQSPDNAEGRYLLGRLLRELGVWAPAEQQLTAAVHADDRFTSARRELAGLLMLRGDFGKAREMYTELLKDEKDSELLLATARAERLDGAPEKALATLLNVRRQTGEIAGKFDEELLAERARSLLGVGRGGEVVNLLTGPSNDLTQLKKLTLPALLIRAHVSLAEGSQQKPELGQARALLGKLPSKPPITDADVRLAEGELLIAEGKRQEATQVLTALVASLQTVAPTSNGEDTALRQQAQRILDDKKN